MQARQAISSKLALGVVSVLLLITAVSCSTAKPTTVGSGSSTGATAKSTWTVALSDSYIGNAWRKTMVKAWQDAASQAKSQGYIGSYRVDVTSENTATAQIAQIQSLILAHVNAIDIDSASPTALNPVIQQACSAGIKVVVFDSLASAPCEYNLADPFATWGAMSATLVVDKLHGHGNVILVQGVVGSEPNAILLAAQRKVLAQNPGIHVVATVDGENSAATTERAIEGVLPSLPTVNGVIVQSGASGAISAFQAAGRPLPVVDFSTGGRTLRLWQGLVQRGGFSATAVQTDPGQGSAAFWESVLLLQGQSVPHNLTWPLIIIHQAALDQWLAATPAGNYATWVWTLPEVQAGIAANLAGHSAAAPPIPTRAP